MTDLAPRLVLDALTRAAARPEGVPLFAGKGGAAGLFTADAAGKLAARRCQDDGLLRVVRRERVGRSARDVCDITDRGLAFLLERSHPQPVLEALVEALRTRHDRLEEVAAQVRHSQEHLAALKQTALQVLGRLAPADGAAADDALARSVRDHLAAWHDGGALGDCPLPELFRRLRPALPALTIGQYHDRLRLLHEAGTIYLHPWTGPLYELPEPAYALLVGHEIAYYASLRV